MSLRSALVNPSGAVSSIVFRQSSSSSSARSMSGNGGISGGLTLLITANTMMVSSAVTQTKTINKVYKNDLERFFGFSPLSQFSVFGFLLLSQLGVLILNPLNRFSVFGLALFCRMLNCLRFCNGFLYDDAFAMPAPYNLAQMEE